MRAAVLPLAVALLATGCGGRPDTPEGAFRAYLKAYNSHDCAALEELVTPDAEVGDDGECSGFAHDIDSYMIDKVLPGSESAAEARLTVLFEAGSCEVVMRRPDDTWLLHDQQCLGTRPDGESFDLGYR